MKQKQRLSVLITGLAVLAVMVMIFLFSAQTAEESTQVSAGLLQRIIEWFRPVIEGIAGHPMDDLALENVLRKLGHFSEYTLLGFLLGLHLTREARPRRRLLCWGTGTAYAVTDELHQLLSDGRAASPVDVGIDSCGVLFGLLVLTGALCLIRRLKH